MGNNNGSFYQHQSNGFSKKTGPRFSHSQYRKKDFGEKVLPVLKKDEEINSFNDSIRGTLLHDHNEINKHCHNNQQKSQFRQISHCGHCRIISKKNYTNQEIKKFRSEPDLRYLMSHEAMLRALNSQQETHEICYRSKKKYKAPLPPRVISNSKISQFQIESSDKRKAIHNEENMQKKGKSDYSLKCHLIQSSQSQKKSRLFKSRQQDKISQLNRTQHEAEKNYNSSLQGLIDDDNNSTCLIVKKEKSLVLRHDEINSCNSSVRRKFLNWNNKNILQRNNPQSESIQSTYRTKYECFEKDSSIKEVCCSIESNMERNQLQINSLQNLSPKISQQKKTSVCINDEGESEIYSKEFQHQKTANNTLSNIFSLNTENLDKIQNLMTNNKSCILKSYNDNNLHELKKIKSNSLYREIYDIKLLNNDENYLTVQKSSDDHMKIDIDKENELHKSKIYLNTNEKKQCMKGNRHLVDFSKKERHIRDDESEEENYLNISFENKRINVENSKGLCQKEILSETYHNKEPLPKKKKKSSLNIEKEISQTEAESKSSSYLNQSRNTFPIFNYSRMKTFYFGMDYEGEFNPDNQENKIHENFLKTDNLENGEVNIQSETEGIALRLRPTLPKKSPEIPRFSPSDAWKQLTQVSEPMSSISDETPVIMQEQKEEPYQLLTTYQRNTRDKSGDSGISAESASPLRTTWTPQQDLDDESSSSDVLYNSQNQNSIQLRPHVFSLSLPRFRYNREASAETPKISQEMLFYDSFQKLKRSVSGVFGFTPQCEDKQLPTNTLDDNWFLSSSAPTSLQNYYINQNDQFSRLISIEGKNEETDEKKTLEENNLSEIPQFSSISKGHVMYLPDTFNNSNLQFIKKPQQIIKYKKYEGSKNTYSIESTFNNTRKYGEMNSSRQLSKSCENISYKTKCPDLSHDVITKRIAKTNKNNYMNDVIKDINNKIFNRPKKFTFQSTVRQIERRRLAEKLSKEAEAKEKQRKNELEAMIKVEEEFQRKRSKDNVS